jgi:hypothetical protein
MQNHYTTLAYSNHSMEVGLHTTKEVLNGPYFLNNKRITRNLLIWYCCLIGSSYFTWKALVPALSLRCRFREILLCFSWSDNFECELPHGMPVTPDLRLAVNRHSILWGGIGDDVCPTSSHEVTSRYTQHSALQGRVNWSARLFVKSHPHQQVTWRYQAFDTDPFPWFISLLSLLLKKMGWWWELCSSVSVLSDYRLDVRVSIPGRGKVFFL